LLDAGADIRYVILLKKILLLSSFYSRFFGGWWFRYRTKGSGTVLDFLDERKADDAKIIALLRRAQVEANISKYDIADDGKCTLLSFHCFVIVNLRYHF